VTEIGVRGERLILLPERAVYWPAEAMLLIADMHCGKAATFRSRHVPIPEGGMDADLERLSVSLASTGAATLAILGDWIHASVGCTPEVMRAIARWRDRHPALRIHWIHGNHDVAPPEMRTRFGFEESPEALDRGPFRLRHIPNASEGWYTIAGHVHPKFAFGGRGMPRAHLPCFCFEENLAILPAFGSFTGGVKMSPAAGRRIYVIADGAVVAWG
jgi:DNA ligase-associated metallophosphoesterase